MRTNNDLFRASVIGQSESAHHFVVTYNFRRDDENTIFEFYRVAFSPGLEIDIESIPRGHDMTFKEELLTRDFASHIAQLQRDERGSEIEKQLREAYGDSRMIEVEKIDPK